jgi:hypothetical protein
LMILKYLPQVVAQPFHVSFESQLHPAISKGLPDLRPTRPDCLRDEA